MKGLYRGFWISSVQIFSGVFYISTYEAVRHIVGQHGGSQRTKALIGGGVASLVGQTIIVPFDVISQHAMVLGMGMQGKGEVNPLGIKFNPKVGQGRISFDIAQEILRRDGLVGFYRGYTASLMAYVPNSAMWWAFYHLYQGLKDKILMFLNSSIFYEFADELIKVCPDWVSHLAIQCVAGSFGGFTTTIITNPLDIVRSRLQVQRLDSMKVAFTELWREEHAHMFFKGLSGKMTLHFFLLNYFLDGLNCGMKNMTLSQWYMIIQIIFCLTVDPRNVA
jgi:solute carrier family 25, member 44